MRILSRFWVYLDINCIQVVEELKVGTGENIVKVLGYLDINSIAVRGKIGTFLNRCFAINKALFLH